MNTVIYTKGIVESYNGEAVEMVQLLADKGVEIQLFTMPSMPEVNNASVDPNGNILNMPFSDEELARHIELNPQINWMAL